VTVSSFYIDWVPNTFFDNDDGGRDPVQFFTRPGNTLAEKLEVAYLERAGRYEQEIRKGFEDSLRTVSVYRGLGRVGFGKDPWAKMYPAVKIVLPGGTETIVFDKELDARLMEIYVLHGWSGIRTLEQGLTAAQGKEIKSPEQWLVVLNFYLFTRNRLILLIRQALIDIEKKAAQDIITRLSETAYAVSTAWLTRFVFSTKKVRTGGLGWYKSYEPDVFKTVYVMGNRELSGRIFALLSETVNKRAELDEQIRRKQFYEGHLARKHGLNSPEIMADIEKKITEAKSALSALYARIPQLEPLVLLALPLLKKGFKQPAMENVIGETLWPFYGKLDELGYAIDPLKSRVETDVPGIREDVPNGKLELESLFPWGYDIEQRCAETAISEARSDLAYLVLLSEESLNRLVATNTVEAGTLASIVCQRYTLTMMEEVETSREFEEALEGAIAKLVAALSLASLVIPALRVAALLLGIPAFVFETYSIVRRLSFLDQVVNQRLVDSETTDIKSLAAVGEIIAQRTEYAEQITQAIMIEIGLLVAGGKWAAFKRGLHLRGYYADLETLLQG
jgi:hypothetical protein